MAHEINTPIQYIGDNCHFLEDSFQEIGKTIESYETALDGLKNSGACPDLVDQVTAQKERSDIEFLLEEIPHAITQCNDGVKRVAGIVRAMKEFSYPNSDQMQEVDLNRNIESTVTVCRNEWKYVAETVLDLDPSLPRVTCLAGEMNQVILNLVINAAYAIGVAKRKESKDLIRVSTRQDGEMIEIRVADDGTGIPAAIQPSIFSLFFTTKDVGKGTGQGLSMARTAIVKKHGGTITFETKENEGTTFIVRIPIAGLTAWQQLQNAGPQSPLPRDQVR